MVEPSLKDLLKNTHFLIRAPRRFRYQYFFRVLTGQIAQQFQKAGLLKAMTGTPRNPKSSTKCQTGASHKATTDSRNCESSTGLWVYRPYTRVVKGYKAYKIIRDYVQLNEQEARKIIRYNKHRLKGLSLGDWQLLWA